MSGFSIVKPIPRLLFYSSQEIWLLVYLHNLPSDTSTISSKEPGPEPSTIYEHVLTNCAICFIAFCDFSKQL